MIIVGLGNPDKMYQNTYHNIGFMCVDKLLNKLNQTLKEEKCKAKLVSFYHNSEKIAIACPQTYMNLSGESVRELLGYFHAEPKDCIVIFDDVDLPLGVVRVRKEGSGGTHNGMKNIVALASGNKMPRIRIGIGKPEGQMELKDFVLSKVAGEKADILDKAFDKVASAIIDYFDNRDLDLLMRICNG
ncbi:MAG: aminoacyl-tRNA hydrolase [Clostridia bacterium]